MDRRNVLVGGGAAALVGAGAAGARGQSGELRFSAADAGSILFTPGRGATSAPQLFDAIPLRQSTRADYDGRSVGAADVEALAEAAKFAGVDVVLVTNRAKIDHIRDLILAANTVQMADPAFGRELQTWLRFNPRQAMASGDGLFSPLTGNPTLPDWAGPVMFNWFCKTVSGNEKYRRQIDSSAGLAIFVSAAANPENWILAGRAAWRLALRAKALGLKHDFVNQPVEAASFRPEPAFCT